MRRAARLVGTLAISAGAITALGIGVAGAGSEPVEENLAALTAQLRCPDGDMIMTRIVEVDFPDNDDENEGAATAEEALGRVLKSSYKALVPTQFTKTSSDGKHAIFKYEEPLNQVLSSSQQELTGQLNTSGDEKHLLAEYEEDTENATRFIASVRDLDEGWALTAFTACNSTLVEAQG